LANDAANRFALSGTDPSLQIGRPTGFVINERSTMACVSISKDVLSRSCQGPTASSRRHRSRLACGRRCSALNCARSLEATAAVPSVS